ncbi:hypothetical protein FHX42_001470 [Saccharopolyspora lacisalsi]|uniref:Uncharacterized protein n=1 Tax=Halosaccharopolyspora lacisalsi TaxID=1000566 RepID=A0A839DY38_9PSEU|nr:hypothetical protein [Halosaccharopolyspora lacisalsi]MBA8824141.1 hypothetical protein [Halosaccharopolyspora lacisalsi]
MRLRCRRDRRCRPHPKRLDQPHRGTPTSATEPALATNRGSPSDEGSFRISVTRPHREKIVFTPVGPLDLATTSRFVEVPDPRLRATTPCSASAV